MLPKGAGQILWLSITAGSAIGLSLGPYQSWSAMRYGNYTYADGSMNKVMAPTKGGLRMALCDDPLCF
jgi:hypothetical protein